MNHSVVHQHYPKLRIAGSLRASSFLRDFMIAVIYLAGERLPVCAQRGYAICSATSQSSKDAFSSFPYMHSRRLLR